LEVEHTVQNIVHIEVKFLLAEIKLNESLVMAAGLPNYMSWTVQS